MKLSVPTLAKPFCFAVNQLQDIHLENEKKKIKLYLDLKKYLKAMPVIFFVICLLHNMTVACFNEIAVTQ